MKTIDKIKMYMDIQEKKELISKSMDNEISLVEAIEIVKKSEDKNKTISMFPDEIKEQIKKLVDGGILLK